MPVVRSIRDGCTDFTSVTGKRKARGTERERMRGRRERTGTTEEPCQDAVMWPLA